MEEYTPNSHKYKAKQAEPVTEKKKIEKVISGTAKTKKKSELQKAAGEFVSNDIYNIKNYIWTEVLIPSAKKLISNMAEGIGDIIRDSVNMSLFGEVGVRRKSAGERTPYRSFYGNDKTHTALNNTVRTRSVCDYEDIIVDSKGEAESILAHLDDLIVNYGMASVAELYQLAGIRNYPYTCNNYGWTDLRSATSQRLRDGGYLLKMPRALPFD